MSQDRPGRVRVALAKRIKEDLGFDVKPREIWEQQGGYRHEAWDLPRWGVHLPHSLDLHSWDTMTECARNGLSGIDDHGVVCAKDPK